MPENKTQPTDASVDDFLNSTEHPQKRADSFSLKKIMEEVTGEKAVMWGDSIVGFGKYHYHYESGRKGEFLIAGFAPRKASMSLYLLGCMENKFDSLMANLGKHKTGASCIYFNKLSHLNEDVLRILIKESYDFMKEKYPLPKA
ncbi:DUF1801 domain-containing protein [Algoriphagus boritolerans]|uniref:YdhG-like domain-containing protein n=1 Tax=Algoriphagus boritolerans DSM 17298 = JCM 18970 TaxID=1120964 RepID=A0A1H5S3Q2_9BACT|nr:DUF1801 domain-containing protein [Algoriphagus boritolerans]SEF45236.1 protein of unknown function (DU1801) [Algoriphagus boritolerans DSM 17298 = JCM 18970]